jgi:hypothetical protein
VALRRGRVGLGLLLDRRTLWFLLESGILLLCEMVVGVGWKWLVGGKSRVGVGGWRGLIRGLLGSFEEFLLHGSMVWVFLGGEMEVGFPVDDQQQASSRGGT